MTGKYEKMFVRNFNTHWMLVGKVKDLTFSSFVRPNVFEWVKGIDMFSQG